MGRNHPESAPQFHSAQGAAPGELGRQQATLVQPGTDRRPGRGRLRWAAAAASLVIAVPGMAATMGNTGESQGATTPTPPSHSKVVDRTCHVSAGKLGHSANKDQKRHAIGDQGWQHFKNRGNHPVNIVFGEWVDIKRDRFPGDSNHDVWTLYKAQISDIPPGYTARMRWIVDRSFSSSTGYHISCSAPVKG